MRHPVLGTLLCVTSLATAQRKEPEPPLRLAARGTRGAIAAGSEQSAQAGMRLYVHGGNAVDAGIAAMLAAAVAEFSHFGFGGEAPILIRAKDGRVFALAGVGTMPKAATAAMFRERRPNRVEMRMLEPGGLKAFLPSTGLLPALVPGMVEAALVALREFGTKSFGEVATPATELADGLAIDETRSGSIRGARRFFDQWPTSRAVFVPDGRVPMPGEIFRQPHLAATLRAMAAAEKKALAGGAGRTAAIDAVRDYFYRGLIARKIDAFCRANGGLLRYEDMAAFRLSPEQPASTQYRDWTVYKAGFWSQGPVMLQTLNLLETYDIRALRANAGAYLHALTEIFKLTYADRDTYYGDPRVVKIPSDRLLSKAYAAERRKLVGDQASLEFRPGRMAAFPDARHPSEVMPAPLDPSDTSRDTTCIDAIDSDGVMFSSTPSGAWMPAVIAGDTGIPLTQRAQSFLLIPGHANELAGGKRPRVTLSPSLVTWKGKALLALSTPGGDNQDQALLQVMLNILEFGMSAQVAIEAPRIQTRHLVSSFDNHPMYPGDLLADERISPAVVAQLTERGHKVTVRSRFNPGAYPVVVRVTPGGVIEAGAEPAGYRVAHAW
jgi:gamma-glutamyltranspeptidase/glutathione hydrolase